MTYQTAARQARLALVGDVMLSRSLKPFTEPAYLDLLAMLRGSDLAFANLETVVREPDEGLPNFTMGTPMTTPPTLLEDALPARSVAELATVTAPWPKVVTSPAVSVTA